MVAPITPRTGATSASHGAREAISHITPSGDKSTDSSHRTPRELRVGARALPMPAGVTQIPRAVAANATRDDALVWTEVPSPLDGASVPSWPTGALRGVPARVVATLAESVQVPADLAAMMLLGVASVALAGRFVVVPRDAEPNHREAVHLYTVVALPPGERKSPVTNALAAPLLRWEASERERLDETIARTASAHRTAKRALEKAEASHAAAMASGDESAADEASKRREACAIDVQRTAREVVVAPRLFTSDATPEKLVGLMIAHKGRMALLSDEGGGIFEMMAGRYSDAPNLDIYLKGHDGGAVRVDRQGRESECIDRATLAIATATQPATLATLAKRPEMAGRGLLARFLYSLPRSNVGFRKTEPEPLDGEALADWRELVVKLLSIPAGIDTDGHEAPHVIRFGEDARPTWDAWRAQCETSLRPGQPFGDNDRLREWGGKLVGTIARVAALLHIMEHPHDWCTPIDLDTTERAIALASYFAAHARAAFGMMGDTPAVVAARKLLAWLQREGRSVFTVNEAHRALDRNGSRREVVDPVLDVLLGHGWVQRTPRDPAHRGRPTESYSVHPRAFAK